jgi:hypothetical protein
LKKKLRKQSNEALYLNKSLTEPLSGKSDNDTALPPMEVCMTIALSRYYNYNKTCKLQEKRRGYFNAQLSIARRRTAQPEQAKNDCLICNYADVDIIADDLYS